MALSLCQLLPENSRQYREEISRRISWGHWFALFNVVLALLIASRYAFNSDWPNTLFGKLYFFISLFGHFSFIIFAFYLLFLFPLSFLIKNNRTFRGISVIIATLGMTALLLDTEIYKRFYLHLSPLVWDLLVNPDEAELSRQWQLLFVPMPLILLAEMLYSRWCWQKLRSFNRQKWGKYVALLFVSCFTATHLLYAWADFAFYRPITAQKANYPLAYPMTARTFLERHGLVDKQQLEQQIEESGRPDSFYLNYPKRALKYHEPRTKINLLFVNLSGLENQDISAETMPNLFKISQQSRQFMHHYTAGDSKSGSISSLFYGISGRYIDAILNERAPSVLISTLQKLHYQFGLFSHNGFSEPIYHRALFADFMLPQASSNMEAVNQWQTWLSVQKQPFFSYVDLTNTTPARFDMYIGMIWQKLIEQGLTQNTLVVFTADIASLAEMDNTFDGKRLNVPMMVYWQGDRSRYLGISSHLDIVPTLLSEFLGILSPVADYSQGVNLTQTNDRRWLLASNYKRNVAILPNGEQYHIDRKGDFDYYNERGEKQKYNRSPLALFLQLIQQSNQFIEK